MHVLWATQDVIKVYGTVPSLLRTSRIRRCDTYMIHFISLTPSISMVISLLFAYPILEELVDSSSTRPVEVVSARLWRRTVAYPFSPMFTV